MQKRIYPLMRHRLPSEDEILILLLLCTPFTSAQKQMIVQFIANLFEDPIEVGKNFKVLV